MEIVKSDESKPVVKETVQESPQSLEEKKITERLRLLKIIIDEKAEESAEKGKYPPSLVFRGENHVIYETMKHLNISKSFVVSPLSINLGWFPFYNKTNPETRKKLRKHVLEKDTNQRVMENYFHELFGLTWSSDVEAINKGTNFTGKTPKLNFKISSYFSPQNRDNRTITSRFHTSKTTTRAQEFITWETNEHYYHATFHLRIVKLRMEGNVLLTVFLPKEYYELKEFMKEFKSKSIHIPFFSTQPKSVQITLPTFRTKSTTEIKHIMGEFELKEETFVHEAEFQLNQSGVNVPHVRFEGPPVEQINLLRYDEAAIEFHAIRPFLFMLTKSNHIMYMGWYQ
ncbi:unnamed protein product [Caenorhabditis brenneri]